MIKYDFRSDYLEWAHPDILNALLQHNLDQQSWYGNDDYCNQAKELILQQLWWVQADIHFVSWWTQANQLVISSILKPYESVISNNVWHITVHEAWAIEFTLHKINTVSSFDGKIITSSIKSVLADHTDEHMVKPRLVYITNATEVWTIYSKEELTNISQFCRNNWLYLYMDGARLWAALNCEDNDLTLADIAKLVDAFYIWWTKNWALLWEAIVITNDLLKENFRYYLKQRGALLAKWRILWIQFLELFKNNLYFDLAKHANQMASKLTKWIESIENNFLLKPTTNQIFPIFRDEVVEELSKKYWFYVWEKFDDGYSAIRLVTSWATQEKVIDEFLKDLKELIEKIVK